MGIVKTRQGNVNVGGGVRRTVVDVVEQENHDYEANFMTPEQAAALRQQYIDAGIIIPAIVPAVRRSKPAAKPAKATAKATAKAAKPAVVRRRSVAAK